MKVKNKLTGEINIVKVDDVYFKIYKDDGEFVCLVTLKELNEGWEDAPEEPEEPEEYWYIENNGDIDKETYDGEEYEEKMIEIGNYFETKEEAEKAVRRLKAWKRLKDNGFKFLDYTALGRGEIKFEHNVMDEIEDIEQLEKDLNLLFLGGDK